MNNIIKVAIAVVGLWLICCNREARVIATRDVTQQEAKEIVVKKDTSKSMTDFLWAEDTLHERFFPGAKWVKVDPAVLGWNTSKLEAVKDYYEQLNADACMIVQHGYVIAAWGDVTKPIPCRSIRKSFLGSLIGIYQGKGIIDLNKDLKSLHIDEKNGLTETEKKATVRNLVASRSGIFLPAAYDPNDHPVRGTYSPGEVWHYNNWDFNVLLTIFEQETHKKIFQTFQDELANPLHMQDFNINNTEYVYEDVSLHPAYLFKTSARDDARLGLLWLNQGRWQDNQIIPTSWMKESTSLQTDFKGNSDLPLRDGYGYLFWIDKDKNQEVVGFSALGASGQFIYMNYKYDLIIVLRADPGTIFKKWFGLRLDPEESYRIVDLVLTAASGK